MMGKKHGREGMGAFFFLYSTSAVLNLSWINTCGFLVLPEEERRRGWSHLLQMTNSDALTFLKILTCGPERLHISKAKNANGF